jgi:hypothetical protein
MVSYEKNFVQTRENQYINDSNYVQRSVCMPEGELRSFIRNELKTQIDGVWRIAENYHRIQQGDNDQGMIHCKTVESNLHKLIPDEKKGELRQIDLFLLSAAACLHDIGKVDARGWEDHGERSMQLILEHYRELGLDKGQAVAVALIASVHNHGYQWTHSCVWLLLKIKSE